ncbi:hypothetical protein PIB30_101424, partial [Stylosanthes scabra]|nr:hypothetical protein [Stylosanthes scabra]
MDAHEMANEEGNNEGMVDEVKRREGSGVGLWNGMKEKNMVVVLNVRLLEVDGAKGKWMW